MDDAEFLKQLTALDKDFAERWKKQTGGKLKTVLTEKMIDKLMLPLLDDSMVTPNEARCVTMLWAWCKMDRKAGPALQGYVSLAYLMDYFFKGSAKALLTADELKPFDAALGMGLIGKLSFLSPGTGISYAPNHFTAIRLLITDKKISVFSVNANALQSRAGLYRSDMNRLVVYEGLHNDIATVTIVHEVAHAIQDWLDASGKGKFHKHKFTEADAYVCGGVAAVAGNLPFGIEYDPVQKTAAQMVIDGKAATKSADWDKAYAAVVKAVEADPTYADTKNRRFETVWKGEKAGDEKAAFEAKLKALAKTP